MALTPSDFTYAQLITGSSPSATNSGQILLITEDNVDSTFWSNINNGGGGLRASEDALGVNQLPLDVVLCDTATEQLIAWTRKPSYTTGDRDVYLFAKNSGTQPAASASFGSQEVWQDCESSLTFQDASGGDSTGAASWAVNGSPSVTPSKIGNGIDLNGTTQYLSKASALPLSTSYSVSSWIKIDSLVTANTVLSIRSRASSTPILAQIDIVTSGNLRWIVRDNAGNIAIPQIGVSTATYYHVFAVRNGGTLTLYIDGSSAATDTDTFGAITATDSRIGGSTDVGGALSGPFNGIIDDLTIYNEAVSSSKVGTTYANQNNPSTFWTQGTPYDPSGGTIELTGATSSYSYNAINAGIDLTPEITVTGGTASYSYNAINASIELTSEIVVTGQTANYSYSSVNATVELTGIISVIGQTATYSYNAISANIDLTPELVIVGSTATYSYSAVNANVSLDSLISVVGNTASYSYSAVNATVELAGEIVISGQTSTYSYSAISATITFPTDIFSYADDAITIVLSGNYITKVTYDEFVVKID
jgi:hypothetical protein